MACVVNVFIVHNTKTSTASYMRWKQNHCYRVPISTSRTHRCCNEVKRFFLLSVSRCGISRRQAHVQRVTLGKAVILNYECSIWREFPVWDNRRYSSLAAWKWQLWKETITHAQTIVDTVIFVHCLLNWMLMTNICPTLTHPRIKALRKLCGRSAQIFHLRYVGLHLVVRLWSLVWVTCGLRALWWNSLLRNADV